MKRPETDIGQVIRRFRKECGMTQAEFAQALQIAPNSIYRYEAGLNEPDLSALRRLRSYANERGSAAAVAGFDAAVNERVGIEPTWAPTDEVAGDVPRDPSTALLANAKWLAPEDNLLVVAVAKMLRSSETGDLRVRLLRLLVEPWIKELDPEVPKHAPGKAVTQNSELPAKTPKKNSRKKT